MSSRLATSSLLLLLSHIASVSSEATQKDIHRKDYCIIGAGPGGVQLGHYFNKAGFDYVIFERAKTAGSFFRTFPIHRELSSMNKRFPKSTRLRNITDEFRLRHDWNSLLDGEIPRFETRTTKLFPDADELADYIEEFAKPQSKHIMYDTEVESIAKFPHEENPVFEVRTKNGFWHCKKVIVATGMSKPVEPHWPGSEYVKKYHELPANGSWATGMRVGIVGMGNAGFEVSHNIKNYAPEAVMFSRHDTAAVEEKARELAQQGKHVDTSFFKPPILPMAFRTHYQGDVRLRTAGVIERYQLKSMDGLIQYTTGDFVAFPCHGQVCFMSREATPLHRYPDQCLDYSKPLEITVRPSTEERMKNKKLPESMRTKSLMDAHVNPFIGTVVQFTQLKQHNNSIVGFLEKAGTMARSMGLKEGDVMTQIDGKDLVHMFKPEDAEALKNGQMMPFPDPPFRATFVRNKNAVIVVGSGISQETADATKEQLVKAGISEEEISIFEAGPKDQCDDDPKTGEKTNCRLAGERAYDEDLKRKKELGIPFDSVGSHKKELRKFIVQTALGAANNLPKMEDRQKVRDLIVDLRNQETDDPMRPAFDAVVACLGWQMDTSIFDFSAAPVMHHNLKFPEVTDDFESTNVPGLYFVGELMHSVDWKKSAGGFINGFRYLAKLLYRNFEQQNGKDWPHETISLGDMKDGGAELMQKLTSRWQSASSPFQMFQYLGDGVVFRKDGGKWVADYYEDISLNRFRKEHAEKPHMVWFFKYGDHFQGAQVMYPWAPKTGYFGEVSQFLHPVLEFYDGMAKPKTGQTFPPATSRHYIHEDAAQRYSSSNHRFFLKKYMQHVFKQQPF